MSNLCKRSCKPWMVTALSVLMGVVVSSGLVYGAEVYLGNGVRFSGVLPSNMDLPNGKGKISYPDGTTVEGAFINGKPDGLIAVYKPEGIEYIIEFLVGVPLRIYKARQVMPFASSDIEAYQAPSVAVDSGSSIDAYQASSIVVDRGSNINAYQAPSIAADKGNGIEVRQAETFELLISNSILIESSGIPQKYEVVQVTLNPSNLKAYQEATAVPQVPPQKVDTSVSPNGNHTPDYTNPLVMEWTSYMTALPFLIYGY